ncbi:hypothetical protein APX70_200158 [Pseudomonas syringae pv. maculicola]|uniref:Uncharacterized protein n=1 Tax=Pseudomonas syringae pv. maculicola TaxID=59511 RepID=A0A3M2YQ86_PSEYM|nr:hypothetical protein APX70_200158 [Pseudomonas syringae pv. maculicola]
MDGFAICLIIAIICMLPRQPHWRRSHTQLICVLIARPYTIRANWAVVRRTVLQALFSLIA